MEDTKIFSDDDIMFPKTFVMIRNRRVVAYGVIFNNKKCVINWEGEYHSTVVWDSFDHMMKVNGHLGTRIHFDKRTQVVEEYTIDPSMKILNVR